MLRERLGDFEHVKGALGHDTVETIVQRRRDRENRRLRSRNGCRDGRWTEEQGEQK